MLSDNEMACCQIMSSFVICIRHQIILVIKPGVRLAGHVVWMEAVRFIQAILPSVWSVV
jgi:hypothetical protein